MGGECKKCLKEQEAAESNFLSCDRSSKDLDVKRVTRFVNTGFFSMNTSFFVSTEHLQKLNVQHLVIFTDSLDTILENSFLRELGDSAKVQLQDSVAGLKGKVKFHEPGDFVNIADPFPNMHIFNLLIGWLGVWSASSKKHLPISISKTF